METTRRIRFDRFCLDVADESLWQGPQAIKLRPKAFAVLDYLLGHPRQLVTKEELLNAVWPETFVGEAVLKVAIRQIREALGDDPKSPRFIETAHRRGYRFMCQIAGDEETPAGDRHIKSDAGTSISAAAATGSVQEIVGRDTALAQLRIWLDKALKGERQIAFVTGEAGIGKTTLVDTFAGDVASDRSIRIARGYCVEQFGTSEAYLPLLEAIGRLCREDPRAIDVLRAHAPMWLLQMPALVSASERESLNRELSGATRERMLREMAGALDVLTADRPLVLILEDLHWSDYSTLDLISYLATQRQPAHLLLIGTYRPAELIASGHPLHEVKRELLAKRQCRELLLEYLNQDAVSKYLSVRFPGNRFPSQLATLIHERTEGNPLFMVNVLDYLAADGFIGREGEAWKLLVDVKKVEIGVPDSIRQMIEKHIDHLGADEQRLLEAASVAGAEFATVAVVAGLEKDRATVEARCEQLARRHQFIRNCGVEVLPNGEAVSRYGFIHSLYRRVLCQRIPTPLRVQMHRRMGERGEELYGDRTGEIAAELAWQFDNGQDYKSAAKYLQKAADNAIRRFAYHEAVELARHGLELLRKLPDSKERLEQELCMQLTLGVPLIATQGYAAPGVGIAYKRARELSGRLRETPDTSEVLWGLWTFHTLRAELETAREIAEELLRLGERLGQPGVVMRGHWATEITFMHLGEFCLTLEHFAKALSLYNPGRHLEDGFLYALNPGVAMPCFAAWALWFLGQPEQALHRIDEALNSARALSEPLGMAHSLFFAAMLHQLRREPRMAQEYAEAAIGISGQHGLLMYHAMATIPRGWALIQQGGPREAIVEMRQALAALEARDTKLVRPHFLALVAESLDTTRQFEEGLPLLEEALGMVQSNGEGCYQAELYRLKGELILRQTAGTGVARAAAAGKRVIEVAAPGVASAERCFGESIKIARRQKAKSLELRAMTSLARVYHKQSKRHEARDLLANTYAQFTEGFDTADLRDAKALLDELSS